MDFEFEISKGIISFVNWLLKKKKYELAHVFTPSTSARLTFVERKDIERQINKALIIPGMQLVVYGHSGSGKTTITQNILNHNKSNFIIDILTFDS